MTKSEKWKLKDGCIKHESRKTKLYTDPVNRNQGSEWFMWDNENYICVYNFVLTILLAICAE